jgi:hypothetical protein
MNLTRPTFDAATALLARTPEAMTSAQCNALWRALVPDAAQRGHHARPRWTPKATSLRAPLLCEINTVNAQRARQQFRGQVLTLPDKPPVDIGQLHTLYASRLNDILLRIDTAMRAHGHWCTPNLFDDAQPLRIVVANEHAALRHAGNDDWTQWEDLNMKRRITSIFAAFTASKPAVRGTQWQPYLPNGSRKRGAAALTKQMREWHGAFHDAVRPDLDHISQLELDAAAPLLAFYKTLRSPLMSAAIEDAIRVQCAAHKGPRNYAFTGLGRSIWHALPQGIRLELAHEFHTARAAVHDALRASGQPELAAKYSFAATFNPFALTEEERAAPKTQP